jgi:hypothetical protein
MLQPDPAQGVRIAEIISSLHERVCEATERGWLGEVEGLQVSLNAARQKLQQMRKIRMAEKAVVRPDPPPPRQRQVGTG